MSDLWDELDNVAGELKARFDDSVIPNQAVVRFIKKFTKINAGTKAVVVDRMGDYYAVTVKGNYIEGIHRSYLKEIK